MRIKKRKAAKVMEQATVRTMMMKEMKATTMRNPKTVIAITKATTARKNKKATIKKMLILVTSRMAKNLLALLRLP